MAEILTNEWTAIRVVTLPLVEDIDWRGTNDIAGLTTNVELFSIIPKANTSGAFQLGIMYLDSSDQLVIPGSNSRVTVQLLQISAVAARPKAGLTAKRMIMRSGADIILKGEEIITGEVIGKFKQEIAARIVNTQSEPLDATSLIVIARFA